MPSSEVIKTQNLNLYYDKGQNHVLKNISMTIIKNKVTALIGPSGCGKSSLIRCLNQMNDLIEGVQIIGSIVFDKKHELVEQKKRFWNLLKRQKKSAISPLELRTRVGMVFQKPNPFPMSIYENVAYGPKAKGVKNRQKLDAIVKQALEDAALWTEVKTKLHASALGLSGGQQQRLCIARAIAMSPEVLLMDEPTSSLDPIATTKIEKLISKLKEKYTIVVVTHSMQQATRISDYTAFLYLGELIEFNETKKIFTNPKEKLTNDYISGKMG